MTDDQAINDQAAQRLLRIEQILAASYFEVAGLFTAAMVRDGALPSLPEISAMTARPAVCAQRALAELFPLTEAEIGFLLHNVLTNSYMALAECVRRQIGQAILEAGRQ